jgi:hypothetical protein
MNQPACFNRLLPASNRENRRPKRPPIETPRVERTSIMTRKTGTERKASGALETILRPMKIGVPMTRNKVELYRMTMIVFSRNSVRREMGIVIRYSMREEFPTVVALIIIDPMKEKSKRTLNRDEPAPIFSVIIVSSSGHPMRGTNQTIIMIINNAMRVAPIG